MLHKSQRVFISAAVPIAAMDFAVSPASAEGDGAAREVQEIESQSQIDDLTVQIDMVTVDEDVKVTKDEDGTLTAKRGKQEMVVEQDGSWAIQSASDPDGIAPMWDAGACYGSFVNVYVNAEDDLQWGAQQICVSTANRPHKVNVTLRQGPDRPFAQQTNKHTSYGTYTSSQASNNYAFSPCLNHVTHRSSMVATPYAGGVQWSRVVSTDTVVNCNTR